MKKKPPYNFIEEYRISPEICDEFITYHKNNREYKGIGTYGLGTVDKAIKDSTDVVFYNQSQHPTAKVFFKELTNCLFHYRKKYLFDKHHGLWTAPENMIQHYPKGGGYHLLHYERTGMYTLSRQLVYMLYCNTLKNGGTDFPFQKEIMKAEKGKLVIWPADFTHPHRGVISQDEEKYIVTGWLEIA